MKVLTRSVGLMGLMALTACSSGDTLRTDSLLAGLGGVIEARRAGNAAAGATPANFSIESSFTREQIDALSEPTLIGRVETRDAWSSMKLVAANRGYQTYFTPDAIGVTVKGGVVTSTRGITGDLHAASPDATIAAMRGGAQSYERVLRHLTPLSQIEPLRMACTMQRAGSEAVTIARRTHRTMRFDERCQAANTVIENRYWKDTGTGKIVRSRQWISETVGYLDLYALKS